MYDVPLQCFVNVKQDNIETQVVNVKQDNIETEEVYGIHFDNEF